MYSFKKSIRETLNLSTDEDSSTNTKKNLLVRQNLLNNFFLCGNFTPFISKIFKSETLSYQTFLPGL